MKSKLIELTDGSKLEVKVNFYTLYLVKMNGIDKKIDGINWTPCQEHSKFFRSIG